MIQTIEQKISIEASYLDNNIKTHIFEKLKKTMEGMCTFDNGYIISVTKLIKIGNNKIGCANSLIIFDVTYEAEVLRPKKGDVLSGKVCMVFQHGIFIDVYGKMKVLVPATIMSEYTYQSSDNSFVCGERDIIKNEICISVKIVDIKYDKKQFSCIGKLN
jgi:DNA-directed RNA polymerase subunit E'/Rpb7